MLFKKIFDIKSNNQFEKLTLDIFQFQIENNTIYNHYLKLLKINPKKINQINQIPFLPISLFKTHDIYIKKKNYYSNKILFVSSGTTGISSKHYVYDLNIYLKSIQKGFEFFYGSLEKFIFLGIFPFFKKNSSLIFMINFFIQKTKKNGSQFLFLNKKNNDLLFIKNIIKSNFYQKKIIIFGISHSLLDFIKKYSDIKYFFSSYNENIILIETGGMKGKKKEIIRDELHTILKNFFSVKNVHSEYGMTELLSQAYSKKKGIFQCPPWMKIYIRDIEDPFCHVMNKRIGGIDIIDLSNYLSCPFISTEDLGRKINQKEFEVLGRMDHTDIRGCNTME